MLRDLPCEGAVEIAVVAQSRQPSAATLRRVEDIWRLEQERRGGALFNGRVFSVDRWQDGRIEGNFVDYMWLLAQWRDPRLFLELEVTSLSVSGLLTGPSGIAFGRRGRQTSQNPGCWELIPSGGIDEGCIDAAGVPQADRQILSELDEELGLTPQEVEAPRAFLLIEDGEAHVVDIGYELTTALDGKAIEQRFAALAEPEYEALEIVPWPALPAFLAEHERQIVGVSKLLLQNAMRRHTESSLTATEV